MQRSFVGVDVIALVAGPLFMCFAQCHADLGVRKLRDIGDVRARLRKDCPLGVVIRISQRIRLRPGVAD